jgi:hypothetical protein
LIRMISPDGIVSPWAGLGSTNDGTGLNTAFARIFALESDSGGSLLVAAEHLGSLPSINRIGTDGKIAKLAGTSAAGAQNADGPALSVRLGTLAGVAAGRDGSVYFGDGRILRRVTTQATIETVAGGMPLAAPDGMAAKGAWFVNPSGLQVNRKGEAFVLDGCSIRKVGTDGILSTLAVLGKCGAPVPNGPPAVAGSSFVGPVVIDSQQRVIVAAAGGLHAIGADGNGILLASSAGMEGAFSVAIDSADRI